MALTEARPPEIDASPAPGVAPPRAPAGLSRRSFLHRAGLAGGTLLVVATGGGTHRAYDNGVFEAGDGGGYDAWREWDQARGPLALVSATVLAANPHNSQAWLFRLTGSGIDAPWAPSPPKSPDR